MEIVEVEVKGGGNNRFVRISIDKPEGVTHGDCELVSQQVGTILDVEDVVPGGRYTLEVSSPGVERKLLKPQDYATVSGARRPKSRCKRADRPDGATWRARWPASRMARSRSKLRRARRCACRSNSVQKANLKFEW